ncbi:MAG: tetratricopeptide repeat protein [bacterium]
MRVQVTGRVGLVFLLGGWLLISAAVSASDDLKPEIMNAFERADTAKAINLLNAEIQVDKSYHANYFTLGMIYFQRQQYEKAAGQFETALEKKSRHFPSLYHLGLCQLKLGQVDKAEETFSQGKKKARDTEKGWFENGIGLVMMARQQYQEADRAFRAALVLDPDDAEYHINLGDANFYQGIPSLAIMEFEKALEIDTASTEVYFHWAEACLEMKDYPCAIEKLQVVLGKDSTYAPAWMRAGGIYFRAAQSTGAREERKARFMDAIGSYQKYLALSGAKPDSANVRVYFELAMSFVNVGGSEQAVGYFNDVLSIPYEARDIYFQYAKALWGIQDFVKSGEMLQKHLEWAAAQGDDINTRVDDDELYMYLGDAYFYREDKNYRKAAEYYQKSIDLKPDQKRLVYNLAVSYHRLEDFGRALNAYQKRIDLGIDTTDAAKVSIYKNAGYCALNLGNAASGDAEEDMEMLEEDEESVEVANPYVDPSVNYYEVAAAYMEQYLQYQPDDSRALLLLADTYLRRLSDCAKGVKWYEALLAIEPNNCDAKKALGFAYLGGLCTKNYSKALDYFISAYNCITAEKGACADVDVIQYIASCYHLRAVDKKSGGSEDFKKANEWYGKCLKCDPGNADCKKGSDDTSYEF